ncbi:hypothetical protein HYT54_04150 [Candidatus Woesearchaeota archaeon]|nr:hypothetical protein [Candidatus Woesearchaeota archaeon]
MADIKKQYQELAKKHKLPDFDKLDMEFEVSTIEETRFLLRAIISRMGEKIEFYVSTLGDILHPDSSNMHAIQEYRFFDESERARMFEVYRKLMSSSRQSVEVSLNCDEKEEAEFISVFYGQWAGMKPELAGFFRKMSDSWRTDSESKDDIGYMG